MITPISELRNRLSEASETLQETRDEANDVRWDMDQLRRRQNVLEATLEELEDQIRDLTAELEEHND